MDTVKKQNVCVVIQQDREKYSDFIVRILNNLVVRHNSRKMFGPTPREAYTTMQDWIEKRLSKEWVVYYLKNCTETFLFEHSCGGAVAYTDENKVCSQCNTPVPGKLVMVIQMTIKKDLLRV